jgi:hypothetical protein
MYLVPIPNRIFENNLACVDPWMYSQYDQNRKAWYSVLCVPNKTILAVQKHPSLLRSRRERTSI